MKAAVKNINRNCLVIDKTFGVDSMLFLEAIATYGEKTIIKKVEDDTRKHCLRIYLKLHRSSIVKIAAYINDNSDNS